MKNSTPSKYVYEAITCFNEFLFGRFLSILPDLTSNDFLAKTEFSYNLWEYMICGAVDLKYLEQALIHLSKLDFDIDTRLSKVKNGSFDYVGGYTAYLAAIRHDEPETMELLARFGANPGLFTDEPTPQSAKDIILSSSALPHSDSQIELLNQFEKDKVFYLSNILNYNLEEIKSIKPEKIKKLSI